MTAKKALVKPKPTPKTIYICTLPCDNIYADGNTIQEAHQAFLDMGNSGDILLNDLEFYRATKIGVSVEYIMKEL